MSESALKLVKTLAGELTARQKLELIDDLVHQLMEGGEPKPRRPFRSLRGVLKDLGPAPSAEEIDEVRIEALAGFPREDV